MNFKDAWVTVGFNHIWLMSFRGVFAEYYAKTGELVMHRIADGIVTHQMTGFKTAQHAFEFMVEQRLAYPIIGAGETGKAF